MYPNWSSSAVSGRTWLVVVACRFITVLAVAVSKFLAPKAKYRAMAICAGSPAITKLYEFMKPHWGIRCVDPSAASLTNEMPTLGCTTRLAEVSKVRKNDDGPACTGGLAANGRSKTMSKCTVYVSAAPQKCPLVAEPRISFVPTTWTVLADVPFWLSRSLMIRSACDVLGNVHRAMPLRVVAVSSVLMFDEAPLISE